MTTTRNLLRARARELAPRMALLNGEGAFDVLSRAHALEATGRTVAHLEVGEPDCATPAHVTEAALRSLREGETRYGHPAGLPALRGAIADAATARGVSASAAEVVVTPGAKAMLFYAALATVAPGDEVLVPDPGFPIYRSVVRFAGGEPVSYGLNTAARFALDADAIEARITPRTRALVLNVPHNPTGGGASGGTLERVAELAARHDLTVVSDEVYDRCVYGQSSPAIAALPGMRDRVIVVNSFSKTYAMTGWRLGFGIVPPHAASQFVTLAVNGHSCVPTFVQRAGLAALCGPQTACDTMVAELRSRRDWLVPQLAAIPGMTCAMPAGAFYAFPGVHHVLRASGLSTEALADRLLGDFGVALLPGTAFGPGGDGFLRLSFAASRETLARAVLGVRACLANVIAGGDA